MLKAIVFPPLDPVSAVVRIAAVHVTPGEHVPAGAPVADFEVEFDPGASYQCPPISYFRLLVREPGWLLRLDAAPGDVVVPDACLAVLGSSRDEAAADPPAQNARTTLASILPPQDPWWSGPA